jgi:hypothetical protein
VTKDKDAERRRHENENLVARMRSGETLARIDASATFFPPRPVILKDFKELARIFESKEKSE